MNDDNKPHDEYKQILATANKLENIQGNLDSVIDFFIAPILKLFTKLCNDCLKLLCEREFRLDQFRKAEELVWRRVYHDIYRVQKTKRHPLKKQDEQLVESHFMSGIGFYSSLIVRLRIQYKIYDVTDVVKPLNLPIGPLDNLATNQRLNFEEYATDDLNSTNNHVDSSAQQWARNAIYRSLVYIGDLARYMLETSDRDFRRLAYEFYQSASRFQPDFGLPFNQLATLAGGTNHNLDAVCSYMRCSSRSKVFEGAEGNLRKVFELNNKLYEDVIVQKKIKASDILGSKDPVSDAEMLIRSVIIIFIKLTASLWQAISGEYDETIEHGIVEETRSFFEILREAIDVEPIVPLSDSHQIDAKFTPLPGCPDKSFKPYFLTPTIMYEFSSIVIMLIAKCQRERHQPIDNNLVELTNTLALNLLHYATTGCQRMIISKLHGLRMLCVDRNILTKPSSELSLKDINSNSSMSSQRSYENINSSSGTSRKNLSRLRRKKAAINYSDGGNYTSFNNDSDLSELEETALSTIDALDISSEMSEGDDLIDLDSSSNSGKNSPFKLSRPAIRSSRSQNYESSKPKNLLNTPSYSLPGPDLLTGSESVSIPIFRYAANTKKKEPPMREENVDKLESALARIYLQTFLPTIKVLFDWLLSNVEVINSNIESFKSFNTELANTALLLQEIIKVAQSMKTEANSDLCLPTEQQQLTGPVYEHKFDKPDWVQKFPLSCDFPLMNLSPLKIVHDININFKCSYKLSDPEAGFVTAQCIFAFSHALSNFIESKNC